MQIEHVIGIVIGIPAFIITITASVYTIKASIALKGGIFGKAFLKLAIGIILIVLSTLFLGIVGMTYGIQAIWVSVVSAGSTLVGSILLLLGSREIIKVTKNK